MSKQLLLYLNLIVLLIFITAFSKNIISDNNVKSK
jgi:hypothetical protein